MNMNSIVYFNRMSGCLETEIVYGEIELFFLYHTTLGQWLRNRVVAKTWFSKIHTAPKKFWYRKHSIHKFIHRYDVAAEEAEKPIAGYSTLDKFFSRRLKSGIRPICRERDALVAPADSRVLACKLNLGSELQVKNSKVSVSELLQSDTLAQNFLNGLALVFRLAPKDYHRFHFPVDGVVVGTKKIPGMLESVHPYALSAGAKSFNNKRELTLLQTQDFGQIAMLEVGALTVGTIIQNKWEDSVKKGAEKGYFRFGGSTVILLFEANRIIVDEDILKNSSEGIETLVNYGTQVARCKVV